MTVDIYGIRHHGPGSARAVLAALEAHPPDLVLIEGCPELDAIVDLLGEDDMVPPVAGLVYAVDEPRKATFYPLARFSPEWVAARWALARGVPVRFLDLPATHAFALADEAAATPQPDVEPDVASDAEPELDVSPAPPERLDPIGTLAAAAGYDDAERWWEDAVEQRYDTPAERFDAIRDAMASVRAADTRPDDDPDVHANARREAWMRKVLRAEIKAAPESRLAVVCGAWHAPALVPADFPAVSRDQALLTKLPRTKVAAAWTPWTAARLSYSSGYGAGVGAPGWYQHLFDHLARDDADPRDLATTWLVRVARTLREEKLDASTASVVEAARLAETLATVRGRPSVGLSELDDAAQAVLCEGSRLPLDLVHERLVVGADLGTVPDSAPVVPLAADLTRQQRSLRLRPTASAQEVDLDLRRESQLARSVLLHRLQLLGVRWGELSDTGRTTGTFKESWTVEWRPELAVDLVEASVWGTTIAAAASARAADRAESSADLAELAALVSACLTADLPDGIAAVLEALDARAAVQHDVPALLSTVEPLARTCRYGDVRGVDTRRVRTVLGATVVRACVGLPMACASLDDEAAQQMVTAVAGAQRGLSLLADGELDEAWAQALESVSAPDHVAGAVAGRATRILLDAGRLDADTTAHRMGRRLSLVASAPQAAAWLDGFLAGDAVLLVHDHALLGLVDAWVGGLDETAFEDLLPLVRRTFAQFSRAERRTIGEQLSRLGGPDERPQGGSTVDLDQAMPALRAVAGYLGWKVVDRDGAA
ncbi:hypothetical protein SAMN05192575_107167 [Nocardioides alpinus]|uniref:Uncharacterized protein n=1 Tax=Nocardioides alpinus TaxID=748909 RepID=A0A1I1A6N9_9ACTN|nr:DUF5682 family protein [Nocardioides alpinus]PKH42144.1 hypothetical protein CXG46_06610 [Nocardioides alpinus]SFB32228.1 hypothetical protein SAMN05192575_107167 [Nocardioides alpinus]